MRLIAVYCVVLMIGCSAAFAGSANLLLDPDKVSNMSSGEFAVAVRNAPDVNVRAEEIATHSQNFQVNSDK